MRFALLGLTIVFANSCSKDNNSPKTSNIWSELGILNASGQINSLCSDGINIYAAGSFTNSNGKPYVAKWNGSNWSELGNLNNSGDNINALWVDSLGNVYADNFFQNGPTYYHYVAKWNGSSWSNLGNLNANCPAYSIFVDGTGNVYAGGKFTNGANESTGTPYVAKWDGNTWSEVGNLSPNGYINVIRTTPDGKIFAAGDFTENGKCYVAMWNGTTWVNSGMLTEQSTGGSVYSLGRDTKGNFYSAGSFTNAGSNGKTFLAKWSNGNQSEVPGSEVSGTIYSLTSGEIIYAGGFTNSSGFASIAKWDGTTWSELGNLNANNRILSLCTDNSGNVYAAGEFTNSSNKQYVAIYKK